MEAIPFDLDATGVIDLQAAASTKVGAGRYSLRRILGRGGMGIVWLAYDERLQCEVALKFLPPQIRLDPVAIDDFRRETARSQKLSHPNIIRIHDLYELEGQDAFISMEFVDGFTLSNVRVQQPGRVLSWTFLEPLARQLCEALEYAHRAGIVHRDLKPANLMVDRAGNLKLADFGIARGLTDAVTRSSVTQTTGTLLYMSPQQLDGGSPKITDDIYGIGATLYELITSKPPFFTGDLLSQVRNVQPLPLRERLRELNLINDLPSHVGEVIIACLSKSESQRPQRAAEVAEWLASGQRPGMAKRKKGIFTAAWHTVPEPKAVYCGAAAIIAIAAAVTWLFQRGPGETATTQVAARVTSESVAGSGVLSATVASPPQSIAPQVAPPSAGTAKTNSTPRGAISAPTPIASSPVPQSGTVESQPSKEATVSSGQVSKTPGQGLLPSNPPTSTPLIADASAALSSSTGENSEAAKSAATPPTALQLLRQGNTHIPDRSKNKVVQILSSRTPVDSTPQRWRIIYHDPKARYKLVEVQFEDGQMTRVYEPSRILGMLSLQAPKPLDADKLKIDSPDALRIALALPALKELNVRSAEFELERGYGGSAVWKIQFFGGASGNPSRDTGLGYVILLADDGRVLKEALSKKQQPAP